MGFVFQFYNLVSNLTAKENVELASEIVTDALEPEQVLTDVGLAHRLNNFPAQLFWRGATASLHCTAVAKNPKILLCDEPTGALDYQTGKQVLKDSPRHVSSKRSDGDYRDPQWCASSYCRSRDSYARCYS